MGSGKIRKHRRKRAAHTKGFSLIELMVAMSLFGLSLMAVISMLIESNLMLTDMGIKNQALLLAASRREILLLETQGKAIQTEDSEVIKLWKKTLVSQLDNAEVSINQGLTQDISIEIIWSSRMANQLCKNQSKQAKECMQL